VTPIFKLTCFWTPIDMFFKITRETYVLTTI
jgi:hypothetical protein